MTNFNLEWLESSDNFVGDIKVSKTIITISPVFRKKIPGKGTVIFSSPTTDELILGFVDERQAVEGMKKATIRDEKSFSLPSNLRLRYTKGHYNLQYIGQEEGVTAYRLMRIKQ